MKTKLKIKKEIESYIEFRNGIGNKNVCNRCFNETLKWILEYDLNKTGGKNGRK